MLLAGDMVTFNQYKPLKYFLTYWDKPVIYIAGNHEYYGTRMGAAEKVALEWIGRKLPQVRYLQPEDTVEFHKVYVRNLLDWFEKDLSGPRVVLSHHAPIPGPSGKNRYDDPALDAAYTSRDMIKIIDRHQPDLWVYGHTHQPNDQTFGKTRIISNPRGYPKIKGKCECAEFDPYGKPVNL